MRIYPAIDIRGGRCVRLRQGDPNQETVFGTDPVEMARRWVAEGAQALHVVDLDGAFTGVPQHLELLGRICRAAGVPVQFGGGVRSLETLAAAFEAGAERVVIGTKALEGDFLARAAERFGAGVIAGLDCRDGRVALHGWQQETPVRAVEAVQQLRAAGVQEVVYTDIAKDGMLEGPNIAGIVELLATGIRVVASGGVTTVDDLLRLQALEGRGVTGAIVGKALYTGSIRLPEALAALARARAEA